MAVKKAGIIGLRHNDGHIEVCIIASYKHADRMVFPKGFIEHNEKPRKAAKREAFEEAGLLGKARKSLKLYLDIHYQRIKKKRAYIVYYPMLVETVAQDWPERQSRNRQWVPLKHLPIKNKYSHVWNIVKQMQDRHPKGWYQLIKHVRQLKKSPKVSRENEVRLR